MTPEEKAKVLANHADEVYKAIGKFIVDFEQLTFSIYYIIGQVLKTEGLENTNIIHIIFAGMTADAAQSLARALVSETQTLTEAENRMVGNAFNRVRELIKRRNDVVHSQHYIQFDESGTVPLGKSFKAHRKDSEGVAGKKGILTPEILALYSREADILKEFFKQFGTCIGNDLPVEAECSGILNGPANIPDWYNGPKPVFQWEW